MPAAVYVAPARPKYLPIAKLQEFYCFCTIASWMASYFLWATVSAWVKALSTLIYLSGTECPICKFCVGAACSSVTKGVWIWVAVAVVELRAIAVRAAVASLVKEAISFFSNLFYII